MNSTRLGTLVDIPNGATAPFGETRENSLKDNFDKLEEAFCTYNKLQNNEHGDCKNNRTALQDVNTKPKMPLANSENDYVKANAEASALKSDTKNKDKKSVFHITIWQDC